MCHAQFTYMIEEKAAVHEYCVQNTHVLSVDRMHENHAYKKMYVK